MNEDLAQDILLEHIGKPTWDTDPAVQEALNYIISTNKFEQISINVLAESAHRFLVEQGIEHECEMGAVK